MLVLPISRLCQQGKRFIVPTIEFQNAATEIIENMLTFLVTTLQDSGKPFVIQELRKIVRQCMETKFDTGTREIMKRFYGGEKTDLIVSTLDISNWLSAKGAESSSEVLVYLSALVETVVRAVVRMTILMDSKPHRHSKSCDFYILTQRKLEHAMATDNRDIFGF